MYVAGWIEEAELPEGIMLRHWRNKWKISRQRYY